MAIISLLEKEKKEKTKVLPKETTDNEQSSIDTTGLIKPKYVKNKSVFYKESTYIKDLLGEGN